MEYSDWIKDLFSELKEKENKIITELRKDFFLLVQPVFEKYPSINKISIIGYANYFNDGDPCTYCLHYDSLAINGIGEWEEEEDAGEWEPDFDKAFKEFETKLEVIPTEYYETIFGNNTKIIIYSDGKIEKEDYDRHD